MLGIYKYIRSLLLVLEYRLRKLEKVIAGNLPKYFYHGTTVDAIDSVLKYGLRPAKLSKRVIWNNITNKDKVYLTGDIESAKQWSKSATSFVNITNDLNSNPYYSDDSYVVLRINSKYLDPDLLEADRNTYYGTVATDLDFVNNDGYSDYEYNETIPQKSYRASMILINVKPPYIKFNCREVFLFMEVML